MLTDDIDFSLRQRGLSGKANAVDGARRVRHRDRAGRAIPAPEANAEIQANLDVCQDFPLLFYLFSLSIFPPSGGWKKGFDHMLNCVHPGPVALCTSLGVVTFLKIF